MRNHFLFAGKMNPEADIPDISYCILERIGRSRGCGEISSGIQFLKNGANPTFYFWNKLKKLGLITAQVNIHLKMNQRIIIELIFETHFVPDDEFFSKITQHDAILLTQIS